MWPEAKKKKGVPGITKSDLLAINKVDLAPYSENGVPACLYSASGAAQRST